MTIKYLYVECFTQAMKKLILVGLVAALLVTGASAYWNTGGYGTGSYGTGSYGANTYTSYGASHGYGGYGNIYSNAWGSQYGNHGRYSRSYDGYYRENPWSQWRDNIRVYGGFTKEPSISYRFQNPNHQNRYDSYCASHPGFWAC